MLFCQIEPAIVDKLLVYGPLGAFALVVFFAIRKYGPILIDTHVNFVNDTSRTLGKIASSTERQAESTEQLTQLGQQQADTLQHLCEASKQHHDPKGSHVYAGHVFSTVDTNAAIKLLCQAKLCETENKAARNLIEQAIAILTPKQ